MRALGDGSCVEHRPAAHGLWCLGGLAFQVGDPHVESRERPVRRDHGHLATTGLWRGTLYRLGADMAYGVVHQHLAGRTKEQYEASIAAVDPTTDTLPERQLFHFAGPSADGWFRDDILMPRMQQGIEGGFGAT